MIWIIISAIVIAAVSFYDFSWSNATNNIRNEVVFESRHKSYGAYALRVEYGRQVLIAFLTVALLFGGLVFASKFMGGTKGITAIDTEEYIDVNLEKVKEEKKKVEVYRVPQKTQPAPKIDLFKLVNPIAKQHEEDTLPDDFKNKIAGSVTAKGDSLNGKDKIVFDNDLPFDDGKCKDCPPQGEFSPVEVEELPSFSGWKEYLKKNLKLPADAKEIGIKGKVYVEFTVMADGSVTNVKVKSGLLKSVDNEAVRVIKNMPAKWEPGKINGHAVNVRLSQPIVINAGN